VIYIEQRPPSELVPWVACFWQISGESAGLPHRVLPDGCADWLIDLQKARRCRADVELVGPMTTAQVVQLQGPIDLLGIRLRPGVLGALGIDASEVLDVSIPAGDLAGAPQVSAAQLVESGFSRRAALLASAVRERLARQALRPDPLVRQALAAWSASQLDHFPRIAALARQLAVSERALERRFRQHVGLTPAGYRRVARFRAVLRLHAGGLRDWASLAASGGFSDQPHLVRDFRELAGLSPATWAATQASPAGFLQDGQLTAL
jgi:AraC-like DNA-binding protein